MCQGIISKIILFLVIFAILVASIILIVFGSIGLADPVLMFNLMALNDGMEYLSDLINVGNLIYGVSLFMVVLGSLLFLQSIVGFCGVSKSTKTSLIIFWISLILTVCTELGLICYAAIYPKTYANYNIQYQLKSSLYGYQTETINPYTGDITFSSDVRSFAWQNLQSKAICCGAGNDLYNGYKDYANMHLDGQFVYQVNNVTYYSKIPPSCCYLNYYANGVLNNVDDIYTVPGCFGEYGYDQNYNYYNQNSCWKVIETMVYTYNYISIFTCSALITAQILGFTLTIRIWNVTRKEQEAL